MSNGLVTPFAARKAAAVVGIICKLAVFITASSIISSDALYEPFDSSLIAAIPNGVEAFPNPRIFAARFAVISAAAFALFLVDLNRKFTIGLSNFANFSINPARSATRIIPHQKHIIPHREITSSTASPDLSKIPADISEILPFTIANISETTGITISKIFIKFTYQRILFKEVFVKICDKSHKPAKMRIKNIDKFDILWYNIEKSKELLICLSKFVWRCFFMKATGIVRTVDHLGRVVIPIELRRNLDINDKDSLEIYVEDDHIILKKYSPACCFCSNASDVTVFKNRNICSSCLAELMSLKEKDKTPADSTVANN